MTAAFHSSAPPHTDGGRPDSEESDRLEDAGVGHSSFKKAPPAKRKRRLPPALEPSFQTPAQGGGAGEGRGWDTVPREAAADRGKGLVRVRPRTPEQHRHTPSLRGGC